MRKKVDESVKNAAELESSWPQWFRWRAILNFHLENIDLVSPARCVYPNVTRCISTSHNRRLVLLTEYLMRLRTNKIGNKLNEIFWMLSMNDGTCIGRFRHSIGIPFVNFSSFFFFWLAPKLISLAWRCRRCFSRQLFICRCVMKWYNKWLFNLWKTKIVDISSRICAPLLLCWGFRWSYYSHAHFSLCWRSFHGLYATTHSVRRHEIITYSYVGAMCGLAMAFGLYVNLLLCYFPHFLVALSLGVASVWVD